MNPAGRKSSCGFGLALFVACTALLAFPACKVVRDDEQKKGGSDSSGSQGQGFDAAAWAASVWDAKAMPYFEKDAADATQVLEALKKSLDAAGEKYGRRADTEGSPWSFTLRGTGKVVSANTASRAATLVVSVDTGAGPQEVTLQLGPVIRGTALRDSLPFFSFGDVENRIQFAQVSRALNDKASSGVRAAADALKDPGTRVEFVGAMNLSGEGDSFLVTPVLLRKAKGGRP